MNYKDVRKKIERYEKEHNTAFFIYYDHNANKYKEKLLNDAQNNKSAAISALYDFSLLYKRGKLSTEYQYKKYKNEYETMLDNFINDAHDEDKKQMLINFKKIYFDMMDMMVSLSKKDILKVIKYAEQKEKEHKKRDEKIQMNNERIFTEKIIAKINDLYHKYKLDRQKREDKFFHVGTNPTEINEYVNQITEEELLYQLLINAVFCGMSYKNQNKAITNEDILITFNGINKKYLTKYTDKDFNDYKKVFKKSYMLSTNNRNKIKKSIKLDNN